MRRHTPLATMRIAATLVVGCALWLVAGSMAVAAFGLILGGCVALWSGSSLIVIAVFAAEHRAFRPQRSRLVPDREERRPVPAARRTAAV